MFFVIYSRWTLCSWAVVNGSPTQSIKQTFPVQGNILIGHFFTFTKILQSDLFGRNIYIILLLMLNVNLNICVIFQAFVGQKIGTQEGCNEAEDIEHC